jgi:hypothetical protein
MDGEKLQNATNVVAFYQWKQNQDHVTHLNARRTISKFFHLVKPKDVDCTVVWDCRNI